MLVDLSWAIIKDSMSAHIGFGHECHIHGKQIDQKDICNCHVLAERPNIDEYS